MKKFVYISLVFIALASAASLRSLAPDVIAVFAGLDRTVCLTQNLLITDLEATITGDVNDGDWITFGDGRFQPGNLLTVRYSFAQANQISYVPGSNDKVLGYYRLLLLSDAPLNNPQERVTDEVRINFQTAPPLFCSNNINISLNESCTQKVDATMLQPNPVQPYSNYIITLIDPAGKIIPNNTLTKDHIDKEITFKLGHQCTSNICWGKFKVEDYFPPVFVCKNDTINCTRSFDPDSLGYPIPTGAYIDTLINKKYIIKNWDACSDVALEYTDVITKADCRNNEDKTITRKWKATDAQGNTSFCSELIVVKKISLSQVLFPPNYEGHEKPAFECGDTFPALINGHPSPDTTGSPIIGHCGNLETSFSDIPFSLCGKSYKIARAWFVIDWCTAESITKNQIIAIKDTKAPLVLCQDTIYFNAGAYQCAAEKTPLPLPSAISDCSDYNISYELYDQFGIPSNQFLTRDQQNTFVDGLPVGKYNIHYIVSDACQNTTICQSQLIVEDNAPPYPACDGSTKVALDANGKGRIFATTFDDGSSDNCGIASFKARKMTDQCGFGLQYGDFVDFCCAELGKTIMVAMEVTDHSGNKNTCMVEVTVEDKLKPTITCPPDITLACTDNYDFAHLDIFGTVVSDPSKIKDILVHNHYHNGKVGSDGLAKDNCSVTVSSSYKSEIDCHTGYIYRTFIATDANGLKDSCKQKITILNPDPFDQNDIQWPVNYAANGCKLSQTLPEITGKPAFTNNQCGNIAATYDDTPFFASDSACLKIFRVWTVIDWCQFNQSQTSGKWGPYTQIIKLHNTDKPVFTSACSDTTFCTYDLACQKGNVSLSANAEDPCTESENLIWNYTIDVDQNQTIDYTGHQNNFSIDLPIGTHILTWTVSDPCGNSEKCTRKINIVDCKKPTPYCLSSLTFTLDEVKGSAEIWAKDFDNGSVDNCTASSDLIFTFNGYSPVKTMITQEHFFHGNGLLSNQQAYENGDAYKWFPTTKSAGVFVDCKDIQNGISDTLSLDMTVADLTGNQDFCRVSLIIQDNNGHCDDIITSATLSGKITTEYSGIPKAVKVKYTASEINDSVMTNDINGQFEIPNLPLLKNYKLTPALNTDPIQGVTTLDLVIIQRHILGLKSLDSPYKMLAADVNNSKSITAADLVEIRKLILGVTDKFSKNVPSWVFVAKEGGITDISSPYLYKNYIEIGELTHDQNDLDFIGVKMGDVNESVFDFENRKTFNRNLNALPFALITSVEKIDGKYFLVFRSSEDVILDGMQVFVSAKDNITVLEGETAIQYPNIESAQHIDQHGVNFLLYCKEPNQKQKDDILYSLEVHNALDLNDLTINTNKLSEVYIHGQSRPIILKPKTIQKENVLVTLVTNPVSDDLKININQSLKNEFINYQILNTEGKIVTNSTIDYQTDRLEYNIKLNDNMMPGLYFINIILGDQRQTLKFIRIK
ncbi:MAG: hypothetical protein IPN86_10765 [Saprospiraceae bacterium]|nr:hypothetical protein [Saprospiraceae bacterium]